MPILRKTSGKFIINDHIIDLDSQPGATVSYPSNATVTEFTNMKTLKTEYKRREPVKFAERYADEVLK